MSEQRTKQSNLKRGVKKGGTMFPRINLSRAFEYAKKLVNKTHNGAQPEAVILSGVFGSVTGNGKVKRSALKQFGFLDGDAKGYLASNSAKDIAAAPPEELRSLLQRAVIQPPIFRKIFDTLQQDEVSVARVKQVAMQNRVHQDSADECVSIFIDSGEFAGLCKRNGDQVTFTSTPNTPVDLSEKSAGEFEEESDENSENEDSDDSEGSFTPPALPKNSKRLKPMGAFQINLNIDPTMDPEKLEKHLKLLRGYGLC